MPKTSPSISMPMHLPPLAHRQIRVKQVASRDRTLHHLGSLARIRTKGRGVRGKVSDKVSDKVRVRVKGNARGRVSAGQDPVATIPLPVVKVQVDPEGGINPESTPAPDPVLLPER